MTENSKNNWTSTENNKRLINQFLEKDVFNSKGFISRRKVNSLRLKDFILETDFIPQ